MGVTLAFAVIARNLVKSVLVTRVKTLTAEVFARREAIMMLKRIKYWIRENALYLPAVALELGILAMCLAAIACRLCDRGDLIEVVALPIGAITIALFCITGLVSFMPALEEKGDE